MLYGKFDLGYLMVRFIGILAQGLDMMLTSSLELTSQGFNVSSSKTHFPSKYLKRNNINHHLLRYGGTLSNNLGSVWESLLNRN